MLLEKNLEKKWLIKSENKILGPYNFDQIVDLIRKGQVSLIDEVRDPETRWLYVRENNEFKEIVEEMRVVIDSKQESTMTYQSLFRPSEDSVTKSKTELNDFTDINLETQDADIVKEIVEANDKRPMQPSAEPARVYGVKSDESVQKRMAIFSNKLLLAGVAVVLLSVCGVFGYLYIQKRNIQKQEEEWAIQIKKYKFLGLYQKAVEVYTKLPLANRKKLIPDVLEMFPELELASLITQEDLRFLRPETMTSEQKANLELINFWNEAQKQNFSEARTYLVKATTLQPDSKLIKENEALILLKTNQVREAYDGFKNLINQDKKGRYLVGLTLAFSKMQGTERAQNANEVLQLIDSYTSTYYDYKKELLLTQVLLAHETQNEVLFKVATKQYFNTPTQLSLQFKKPSLLAPNAYTWSDVKSVEEQVQKVFVGDDAILFQLHHYLEGGELGQATEFHSQNISKVGSPAIKEQMNLLLFHAQSRSKEVLALEKTNTLDMDSELNHIILAQNKRALDDNADISAHVQHFVSRQLNFLKDWIEIQRLIKTNAVSELRTFTKEHFITIPEFKPLIEAKGLVN